MQRRKVNKGGLSYNLSLWDNFMHRLDPPQAHVSKHRYCVGFDFTFSDFLSLFSFFICKNFLKKNHC